MGIQRLQLYGFGYRPQYDALLAFCHYAGRSGPKGFTSNLLQVHPKSKKYRKKPRPQVFDFSECTGSLPR